MQIIPVTVFVYICIVASTAVRAQLAVLPPACIDADGFAQDFWHALKLPRRSASTVARIAQGTAHLIALSSQLPAYASDVTLASPATPENATAFRYSPLPMNSNASALGRTVNAVFAAQRRLSALPASRAPGDMFYFAFNDDAPGEAASSYWAHAKSVVAFNEAGGFILVHSMPNFPDFSLGTFAIPSSALIYGQSFVCLSLNPASIDTLGANFQIYNPQVYSSTYSNTSASALPPSLSTIYPRMAAFLSGTRRTATAASNVATLTTRGGVNVTHFAKNPRWARDLYGDLVAPTLNASLWAGTWMRPFEPSLYPPNVTREVINVKQMIDPDSGVSWFASSDHSKWAMSVFPRLAFVCIGDLNKQRSQENRGGGTYCMQSVPLHRAFAALLVTNASVNERYTPASGADAQYPIATSGTPAPPHAPTLVPTLAPTQAPTPTPTRAPTHAPTSAPTQPPTAEPTKAPTLAPTAEPTQVPTSPPTETPTQTPTSAPTSAPTPSPTLSPDSAPPVLASVSVQLRLAVTVATASAPAFRQQFVLSVAASLGINATRVSVTDVIAGSAILVVAIAPINNVTGGPASPSAPPNAAVAEMQQLATSLIAQAANPLSALVAQVAAQTGALVDTTFQPPPPAFAYKCWDGSSVYAPTACPAAAHSAATPSPDSEVKPLGAIVYIGAGAALLLGIVILVYCWCRKRRSQLSYHQSADHTGTRFDDDVVEHRLPESGRDVKSVESGTDLLPRSFVDRSPNLEMQATYAHAIAASLRSPPRLPPVLLQRVEIVDEDDGNALMSGGASTSSANWSLSRNVVFDSRNLE